MRAVFVAAALAAGSWLHPAFAQSDPDALTWLQRMYTATQNLSYSGTFIYQFGGDTETSRVTRLVDGPNVMERVETLDGIPREVVRVNDDVQCYVPGTKTLKLDRKQVAKPFPGMRPDQVKALADFYTVKKAGVERIAGFDCQSILLEPKDSMRYAHKLWADMNTGMLVKAATLNDHNEVLEQFFFTDLKIGGVIDPEQVKSRFAAKEKDWRIENLAMPEVDLAALGWVLKSLPPGYRKITEMKGTIAGNPGVGQIVLSDGMGAASVFMEPLADRRVPPQLGLSRHGAMNIYTRKLDDYLVTVVGEVPPDGVRYIANQVEHRKPD